MNAAIRPMERRDVDAVYALGLRCYDVDEPPYNYWSRAEVDRHADEGGALCFVAEADGDVVGFLLGDETFETLADAAYLEWAAVAPAWRRRGVAERLLETAVDTARALGRTRAFTDIATGNEPSLRLAQKHGFAERATVAYLVKELR